MRRLRSADVMPRLQLLLGLVALLGSTSVCTAAPTVVVSLKSLHSLVAVVMEGIGEPRLLYQRGAIPSIYALSDSALSLLQSADVVIWTDEAADGALAETIRRLRPEAVVVTAGAVDPQGFAWLDPSYAIGLVGEVAAVLARVDAEHAADYLANATAAKRRLQAVQGALGQRFGPLAALPFLVYGDGMASFGPPWGLGGARVLALPDSARRHLGGIDTGTLVALRDGWRAAGINCAVTDATADVPFLRLLVDDTEIEVVTLDPFGLSLPTGADLYFEMMLTLADGVTACIAVEGP